MAGRKKESKIIMTHLNQQFNNKYTEPLLTSFSVNNRLTLKMFRVYLGYRISKHPSSVSPTPTIPSH